MRSAATGALQQLLVVVVDAEVPLSGYQIFRDRDLGLDFGVTRTLFRASFLALLADEAFRANGPAAARLRRFCAGLHDRLRDDKYLVGRTLHNLPRDEGAGAAL